MTKSDFTSIRIRKSTRSILNNIGRKTETHDDIIRRLASEAGYDVGLSIETS